MVQHQQALATIISQDPNVAAINSNVGAGSGIGGGSTNAAGNSGVFIRLKPPPNAVSVLTR
jgi:HAE1 family hydrophobic/amphiphilic exporter-1